MKMDQPNDMPPLGMTEHISSSVETDPTVWRLRFDALNDQMRNAENVPGQKRRIQKRIKELDAERKAANLPVFSETYTDLQEVAQLYEDGDDSFNAAPEIIAGLEDVLSAYKAVLLESGNSNTSETIDEESEITTGLGINAAGTTEMEKLRSNTTPDVEEEKKKEEKKRRERKEKRDSKERELSEGEVVEGDDAKDEPPADIEKAAGETIQGRKEAQEWKTYLETIAQVAEGLAAMEGKESQMASRIRNIANGINPDAFAGADEARAIDRLKGLRRDMRSHLTHFGDDLMNMYGSKGQHIQITGEILLGKLSNPYTPNEELTDAFEKFKKAVEETKAEQEAAANLPAVHESIDEARDDWRQYADILSEYAHVAGIRGRDFRSELDDFKEGIERGNLADDAALNSLDAKVEYLHIHLLAALTARAERFAKNDARKRARCVETLSRIEALFSSRRTNHAASAEELRDALAQFEDAVTPERQRNLTELEAVLREIEPRIERLQVLLRVLKTSDDNACRKLSGEILDVHERAASDPIPDPFVWAQLLDETGPQIHLQIDVNAVKDVDDAMVTKILGNAQETQRILDMLLREYEPMTRNVIVGEAEEIQQTRTGSGAHDREVASKWTPEEEDAENQYEYQRGAEARQEGAGSRTSRLEGEKAQAFTDAIANVETLEEYRAAIYTLDANGVRAKKGPTFTPSGIIYSINQLESLIQNDRARFEPHKNNLTALTKEMVKDNGPLSFVPEKWGMRSKLAELLAKKYDLLSDTVPAAEKYEFVGGWDSVEKIPQISLESISSETAQALDDKLGLTDIAIPLETYGRALVVAPTEITSALPAILETPEHVKIKEEYRPKLLEARNAAEAADVQYRALLESSQKRTKSDRFVGFFTGKNRRIQNELEEKRTAFEALESKFHTLNHEQAQKRISLVSGLRMRKSPEERALGKAAKGTTERNRVRKVQERYRGLVFAKSVMPIWTRQREAENAALAAEMGKSKEEVISKMGVKGWKQYAESAFIGSVFGMGGRTAVALAAGTNPFTLALLGGAVAGSVARQGVMWAGDRAEQKYTGRAYENMAIKQEQARAAFVANPSEFDASKKLVNQSSEVFIENKRKARNARMIKNVAKYAAPMGAGALVGGIADLGSDRAGEVMRDGLGAPENLPPTGDDMGGVVLGTQPVGTDGLNNPESIRAPYQSYTDLKEISENIEADLSSDLAWTVEKDDTVWDKLDEVVSERYPNLDESQKLRFVDTLENMLREKYGDSIDHIEIGQQVDFSDDLPSSKFAEIAERIMEGKPSGPVDIEPSVESTEPIRTVVPAEPVVPEANLVEAAGVEGEEIRAAMLADLENHGVSSEVWNGGFEGHPLKAVNAGEFGQRLSHPFGIFGIKADLEPIGQREDIPFDTVFNTRNTGVLSHTYEMLEERAKSAGVNLDEFLASKAGSGATLEEIHAELVEQSLTNAEQVPAPAEAVPDWAQTPDTQSLAEEWEHLKYEPKSFGEWAHTVVDYAAADLEELVEEESAGSWARHYLGRFNTEMLVPRSAGVIEESGYRGVMLRNLSGENIPGLRKEVAMMRSMLEYVNNKYDGIPGYQKYADELTSIDKMLVKAGSVGGRLDAEAMRAFTRR